MKGWIKVHRYDDKKEYWIQTSNITHVTEDDRGHALICTASDTPKILVMESLNEVLALIEKAENAGADAIEGLARVLEAHMEETRAYISYIGDSDDTEDASYLRGREAALKDILDLLRKETSRWER